MEDCRCQPNTRSGIYSRSKGMWLLALTSRPIFIFAIFYANKKVREGDSMDIRGYVKIKTIPGTSFGGLICWLVWLLSILS